MDIRKASLKSQNPETPQGTEPPSAVADPGSLPPIMEVDDKSGITTSTDIPDDPSGLVIQQYLEYLERNGISREDIGQVLDAIVVGGNVVWDFDLFDRIPVVLRIRPSWVNDYILEKIDEETRSSEKVSMVRYNNMVAVCNLAASMIKFGNETYDINTKEEFTRAIARVRNLNYITQTALVNKLALFDRIVGLATSDWAIKNFTTPQTEK